MAACATLLLSILRIWGLDQGVSEVELDVAAQRASDATPMQRALQAVGIEHAGTCAATEVGTATGQRAAYVDHGALHAPCFAVASNRQTHQLGLRRDARAAYAAAPRHVARYGACPPALS
jgi:hypothetical protein